MFLCCTSQGVVTTVKWSISLVVTSNHKCLNKVVSNITIDFNYFQARTWPPRWYKNKRPRLQSTSDSNKKEEITKDTKAEINMDIPSTSNTAPSSLAVLAEVAQSHSLQSSLPDLIGEQNGGADCPCEDDEEMPPLEGDDATEL